MNLKTLTAAALIAFTAPAYATVDVFCEHVSGVVGKVYQMRDQGFTTGDILFMVRSSCLATEQSACDKLEEIARDSEHNPMPAHISLPGHAAKEAAYRMCARERIQAGIYGTPYGFYGH
jgi:hypothetical protein